MNKDELIAKLRTRFFGVDEDGMDIGGKTRDGIKVWGIGVFDKVGDVITTKNLLFFTKGDVAYWGNFEPNPLTSAPVITFTDRVNSFIASKIEDETIKFAHIEQISELTKKARITAVMPDKSEKNALISEDTPNVFSIEVLI